jgi:hypothetical protein
MKSRAFFEVGFLNESLRNFWISELIVFLLLSSLRSYGLLIHHVSLLAALC